MLSAVKGVTSLRHSQHEEARKRNWELGTSMAGSVMTNQFGPRRAAKKRQASRQADGRRGEREEDESSYH